MHLVAPEAITGAEAIDLPLDRSLLVEQPREFGVSLQQGAEVLGDQRAHRAAELGSANPRIAVDVVGY
jgi:hypothetical protein